jgi:hypothetical protein
LNQRHPPRSTPKPLPTVDLRHPKTIRSELDRALDQGLRYRLIGLREFLEEVEPRGDQEIRSRLNEISHLGELYQVFDARGALIAQSRGLARHGVPQRAPGDLGFAIRYGAGGTPGLPLRFAWQKVTIGSHTLVLGAADPRRKFAGVRRCCPSGRTRRSFGASC